MERSNVHELGARPAVPADHALFAYFFAQLDVGDPVPPLERWCVEMMPTTFFVERDGETLGYAYFEPFDGSAHVRHVVVDAPARGRGVGKFLMAELAAQLRARGCLRWRINVKSDNDAAITLYERCGFRFAYTTRVVRLEWSAVSRLPRDDGTTHARQVEAADAVAIERAFDLPAGQVERLSAVANGVLVQLTEHGDASAGSRCVAFARFDPTFPGAFPFRVARSTLTRTLLDALRPHARVDDAWIQLVIEDDAASADALLTCGATLVFDVLHMTGDVPSA